MTKQYILDTGILLASPYAIQNFEEHDVLITTATLETLGEIRGTSGERGSNARKALRLIESARMKGYRLPGGGSLRIVQQEQDIAIPFHQKSTDNEVLRTALSILQKHGNNVVLVSNSSIMRIKAGFCDLPVESYRTEQVVEPMQQYKGRRTELVPKELIDGLFSGESISYSSDMVDALQPNEYITLVDSSNPQHTALVRFSDGVLHLIRGNVSPYGVRPRNAGQHFAIDALMAPAEQIPLVILKGPAGTAKTFLAMAVALEQVLNQNHYDKILVARPNIKFDEDIGFLKGSEEEKIGPLIRPVMDNLELLCTVKGESTKDNAPVSSYVNELFSRGIITAQAMAYMRGRSIANTYILIDESQNMTPSQAFGIISRVGAGSKVVLAGDPEQIDNPELDSQNNGLSYASECMRGSPLCAQVTFEKDECVRSKLALDAIKRMSSKPYERQEVAI